MKTFKYLGMISAEKFLEHFTIRYSQPKSFNDPFELQPEFYITNSKNRTAIESSIKFFLHGSKSVVEKYFLSDEEIDSTLSTTGSRITMSGFNDQVGILCLTQAETLIPANFLMWAHYAESHQGIAIEFKKNHEFTAKAKKVHYKKRRPIIDSIIFNENNYIAIDDLYFKSTDWDYENETRIAKRLDSLTATGTEDGFGYEIFVEAVPIDSIEWVYIGCNASEKLKEMAIKAHKEKGVNIMFLKAHDQEYKLVPYVQLGGNLSDTYNLHEKLLFNRLEI